ncbi:MAG: Crp/Fnr family transcriptional regulator [Caldilineaceae bacterium]
MLERKRPLNLWQMVPYLQGLAPEIISALVDTATPRRFSAGALIFSEGDLDNALYMVEEGTVKICRYSKEGREQTLNTFSSGDTFNDVAALDGGPSPATAIAFSDVVLWRVTRPDLQQLATRYPTLAWALIESIARRTRYLVGLVQDLSLRSVKSRLAKLLLDQASVDQDEIVPRMLTQEEMASRLGTVREVVGRALRSLAAAGIIEFDRHQIVILDAERLAEEAEV